jgi:hypothetical protein
MKTFYTAKVGVPNAPLLLERSFTFESKQERQDFLDKAAKQGCVLLGFGIEHIWTADEAYAEVLEEALPL